MGVLFASIGGIALAVSLVVGLIVVIVVGVKQHLARTAALKAAIEGVAGFTATQQFMGCDAEAAFAVDDAAEKICLATASPPAAARVIDYGGLLEAELVEDGITLARSARRSRLRGVVMGGTQPLPTDLRRPGEWTVTTPQAVNPIPPGKVRNIELRLTTDDPQQPLFVVKCLSSETARTDSNYLRIMNEARGWHVWFTAVLEKSELDDAAAERTAPVAAGSVADELQKLAELHRSGVLSESEFAAEKARLLARK